MNKQESKFLKEFVRNLNKEELTELKDLLDEKQAKCPKCGETKNLLTERRIDGDTKCMNCGYTDKSAKFQKNNVDWEAEYNNLLMDYNELHKEYHEIFNQRIMKADELNKMTKAYHEVYSELIDTRRVLNEVLEKVQSRLENREEETICEHNYATIGAFTIDRDMTISYTCTKCGHTYSEPLYKEEEDDSEKDY